MSAKPDPTDAGARYEREESEFDRATAFFDATYALALTLLVTTLDVGGDPASWADLGALDDAIGSQLVAFGISFAVIAAFWMGSHRRLASFAALDTPTIVLNLALVGVVILLPFTTETVGDDRVSDLPLPTAVYALNIACASIVGAVIDVVARRRGLLRLAEPPRVARAMVVGNLLPAAVFLASIPVAYLASPDAARWSWLALVAAALLWHRWLEPPSGRAPAA